MKIERRVQINESTENVWQIMAHDFHNAAEWMGGVYASSILPDAKALPDASVGGRVCDFSPTPGGLSAEEKILDFNEKQKTFTFDVVPVNAPRALPFKRNVVKVSVRPAGENKTEVIWEASPDLKAHGYVLYPFLRIGIGKLFDGILGDLKYFAENKKPHPRKLKEAS